MSRPDRRGGDRRSASWAAAAVAALGLLWSPLGGVSGQTPAILSSEITVAGQGATLALDLSGGRRLAITLEGGVLSIDGGRAGAFPAGGTLDTSWRALLADAIASPEDLETVLLAWTPPAGLTGDALSAGEAIRARLRSALGVPAAAPSSLVSPGNGDARAALDLLFRSGRTRQLAAAADGIPPGEVRVTAGEDVTVGPGQTIEGSLVVLDGDLDLLGTVTGDVVILGGTLTLGSDARVLGSVRSADADIDGDRDGVSGSFVTLPSERALAEIESTGTGFDLEALNERIREEVADATRGVNRALRPDPGALVADQIGRGVAGLVRVFLTFGIFFAAGLGVLYFFPRHLEVVARTARAAPGPSILVGAAGVVLALPLWVVGGLFLVASLIGIPALLLWIPGGPAALALAAGLGYMAIARNVGQWVAGKNLPLLGRIDATRPAVHIGAGLAALLAAFGISNVFEMAGSWLEVFEAVLLFAGVLTTVLAVVVGLGAVILSRAGTDASHAGSGWGPGGDQGLA